MKNQQQPLISIAGLVSLMLITTSSAMARSTPVTVQNDASNPVPVTVQNTPNQTVSRQMVGLSTEKKRKRDGVIALNNACNTEFPGSRMCTTVEVMNSAGDFSAPQGAWVRPVLKPVSLYSDFSVSPRRPVQFEEGSGFFTSGTTASLNCAGFAFSGGGDLGMIYIGEGRFSKLDCATETAVACCAAIPD